MTTTFITHEQAIRSRREAAVVLRNLAERYEEEADEMERTGKDVIPLVDLALSA